MGTTFLAAYCIEACSLRSSKKCWSDSVDRSQGTAVLQLSVHDTLMGHAARQPQVDALVLDDLVVSYADFCEQVSSFASWLIDNGLSPGQTAGVCIADECRHLICAMALLCLGTPQMSLGLHEVEFEQAGPRAKDRRNAACCRAA